MITVTQIRGGAGYMGQHLAMNDYYSEGEVVVGHWYGEAARHLGIEGQIVTKETFESLRSNRHPLNGEKLRPRSAKIAYHDFVISAPKSVSIAAMTGGDERLLEAYDRCAMRAFKRLEEFAAVRVRSGESYHTEELNLTGNIAAALFRHDTSRMLDPQLHTHMVVANLTWDGKRQQWLALQPKIMAEQSSGWIRENFYNELEEECRILGYETEKTGDSFRLSAISHSAEQALSQRSVQRERFKLRYSEMFGNAPDKKRIEQFIKEGKTAATRRFIDEYSSAFGHPPSSETTEAFVRGWRSSKMATSTSEKVCFLQRERLGETEYERIETFVRKMKTTHAVSDHLEPEALAVKADGAKHRTNIAKQSIGIRSNGQAEAVRRMKRGMALARALRGHPAGLLVRQLSLFAKRHHENRT